MTVSYLGWLPAGDGGTFETLARMARIANTGQVDPALTKLAHRIILRCPSRDYRCYASAIRTWLQQYFKFIPDAVDVERFADGAWLLTLLRDNGIITGDCDCLAVLGAALGKIIGLPAKFTVLGFPSTGGGFAHVYASLDTGSGWMDLDTTRPAGPVERANREQDYPV